MVKSGLSGAKMYAEQAKQALKQQQYADQMNAVPQYGGDCALSPDGLSSSLQRLEKMAQMLKEQANQIAYFFCISEPQERCDAIGTSASPRDRMEAIVEDMNRVLCALNRIFSHITS